MPELPVVRALTERIATQFGSHAISEIVPLHFAALKTVQPDASALVGHRLESTSAYGKYSILDFGELHVVIHLGQAGRITFENPPKTTRAKGMLLRVVFDDDAGAMSMREYGRERHAAWWVLDRDDPGPLDGLGPEPFDEEFAEFLRTSQDRRRLHTILRDQRTVAGVGRGHADDALHRARLAPTKPLGSLTHAERERLLAAVRDDLSERITLERGRDGGLPQKLSENWHVHARWGEPCPTCARDLARVSFESYEMTYCPDCQTGGKVLADRRTSKFLK